jgi:tetratricopeptide (TPR) repeat protein
LRRSYRLTRTPVKRAFALTAFSTEGTIPAMRWLPALLIVALAPPAFADSRTAKARAYYESGMAHYTLDEYDQAIEAFQAAFRERPDPVFLYNIAQAARLAKKTEMALHYYEKYLHLLSESAPNRAEVEERIASLQKVLTEQAAATNAKPATPLPPAPEVPPTSPPSTPQVAPAETPIVPAAPVPVYRKWWLWTLVAAGAVLIGGAVALGVTLGGGPSPPGADYGPLPIGLLIR